MKIGLALGSGAARGWAHIGIIEALEELGVKIEIVTGCSIGAYVGCTYASGKLPELKTWSQSLSEWQVLGMLGVGINKGGLVSGQKVFDVLQKDFSVAYFNQLSIPFAASATDLHSGKEVNFTSGDLVSAVQASCSIPGIFPPVFKDDRWLVDGAVVNPVPVNLCRQLGADFVIAINLNSDFRPNVVESSKASHLQNQQRTDKIFSKSQNLMQQWFKTEEKSKEKAPSMLSVMTSAIDIMQARVTRSRLAGEPPDLLLEPLLKDVGTMEFHRAEELYQLGFDCVGRMAEQIKYQLGMA